MSIIGIIIAILGVYLGFWLGRRWEWGIEEERSAVEEERSARGGVKLNTVRIRR